LRLEVYFWFNENIKMETRGPNYAHNPFRLSIWESVGEFCKEAEDVAKKARRCRLGTCGETKSHGHSAFVRFDGHAFSSVFAMLNGI
jgi:hypothetical protein